MVGFLEKDKTLPAVDRGASRVLEVAAAVDDVVGRIDAKEAGGDVADALEIIGAGEAAVETRDDEEMDVEVAVLRDD
jgi:hypothetical protein